MSTSLPSNLHTASLASTMIAASTPAPSGTSNVLLPTIGTFPAGRYDSKITGIHDAVQNGVVVGVDVIHQLTNSNGQVIHTSFRYYVPRELDALIKIFASYGLSGALNEVAIGLEEVVDISPKDRSSYLHVAARQLKTPVSSSTSPGVAPSQTSTPPASGLPTSAQPKRRGGLLGSKRPSAPPAPPTPTQIELLDDENDDFEDFLTDEDDD